MTVNAFRHTYDCIFKFRGSFGRREILYLTQKTKVEKSGNLGHRKLFTSFIKIKILCVGGFVK